MSRIKHKQDVYSLMVSIVSENVESSGLLLRSSINIAVDSAS